MTLRTTPFHARTAPLCASHAWRRWAGCIVASSYELTHEHEYHAIRSAAALFDISPLYKYLVSGRDAARLLDRVMTRDIGSAQPGQVLYTPWCDETGKVLDDGTVSRLAETSFRLTSADPNLRWLEQNALGLEVRIEDRSAQSNKTYVRAAERIQAALREDRFVFAYQPIVVAARDGTAGAVSHYECLLRLIDENGQIQAAGAFMPVVEEMGLIRQIDRRVLDMAVGELKRNPTVTLAVNVSAYTAGDRTWLAQIEELLKDRRDLAERLIVEITETVALRDVEESARFVQAVRALGCKVALDDFGAGFTSFRNLRALAVDEVKIDGSYVKNLPDSPDNQVFVRSMVGLARGLKLRTVAECVETEAEARALSAQGVDMFQGYFFGRPNVNPDWRRADPARKVPTKTAA